VSASVLYMSMSLDGYIAGPNDTPDNPGGDGFMRLHDWYGFGPDGESAQKSEMGEHFLAEGGATGAIIAGRRTVEQVEHWGGGDNHGLPIFVPPVTARPARPSRTSCKFIRSRCCSVVAFGCSRCCRRASSWRSFG